MHLNRTKATKPFHDIMQDYRALIRSDWSEGGLDA